MGSNVEKVCHYGDGSQLDYHIDTRSDYHILSVEKKRSANGKEITRSRATRIGDPIGEPPQG